MRKLLTLLSMTGCFSASFAQVSFQDLSYSEALLKAKREGKLIFLQLEAPDCRQCAEVAAKGLSDGDLSRLIDQTFVPLYVNAKHKDRKEIESQFNVQDGFGTLFINQQGTLVHTFLRTTSMPSAYKEQIETALYNAGETVKVSELENEYRRGNKNVGLLEQLLLKKKNLNLNNTELLDEYVGIVPADSLASVHTLQFIASLAPVLGSKADLALRKDRALFSQAWYAMPPDKRGNINARIIYASMNKAVRERNETYALQIASFARGTTTTSKEAAEKAYAMRLLEFYGKTDDSPKYLATAVRYYDNYLMTVSVDSVKNLDKATQERLAGAAKKDTLRTGNGFTVRSSIRFSPAAQRFTWELKEGAWNVYKRTTDPALLSHATAWIKKALDFYESPEALDVYARLLYRQRQTGEAIAAEKRAITAKKTQGYPVNENEDTLALMEKNLSLTD